MQAARPNALQHARNVPGGPFSVPAAGLHQHTTRRPFRASKIMNAACCFSATLAILSLSGGISSANASVARASENSLHAISADAPLPSPAEAMATFHQIESWIRAWSVAEQGGDLPAVSAASITLRLNGSLVGRGTAMTASPTGDPRVIQEAVQQALDEATVRMPVERDALFEEALRRMAPSITISVELAGELVPFSPEEYADATMAVAPGLEGVAVRVGERIDGMFPGTMLTNGTEAGSALAATVSRLTGDPGLGLKRPSELTDEIGAVFYRFRTLHLAHPRTATPPIFLHRGGRTIERAELTSAGLREWADGMADHLISRARFGPEIIRASGTFNPITGASEPVFAGPGEQALIAFSLVQYSQMPGVETLRAREARYIAEMLLQTLASADEGERDPLTSPAAVATSWVALSRLQITAADADGEARTGRPQLAEFQARINSRLDEWERDFAQIPMAQRSIAAFALASRAAESPERLPAVQSAIRTLYRETPPGMLVSHMPWLGWAEVTLASIETDGQRPDIPAAIALREMREQVWKHQLSPADLPFESLDLAGGIIFTATRNPLPTWHSARPLAFVATMIGDERLTSGDEFPTELGRTLASLRFLRQLSAGEAEGHMYRSPANARWGVRASVWDQRMAPEATALTLLTVCEVVRSLQEVQGR